MAEDLALLTAAAPPPSPTNRFADDPRVAEFGQRLWFEKRYAGPNLVGEKQQVSCSTCHDPQKFYSDGREDNRTSVGTARTKRNAPSMVNAVYYEWGNWAGSHDQFWKQGANSPESSDNFNSDRLRYAHVIWTYYRDHYNALFPDDLPAALDPDSAEAHRFPPSGKPTSGSMQGAWETMRPDDQHAVNQIMANCGKALEAYERLLVSGDAPFDRYVAGHFDALSESAKRGLKLFIGKAGCGSCHTDETFTDQQFHNTGLPQGVSSESFDKGQFSDVARLKNLWNGAGIFSDDPIAGARKLFGRTDQDPAMTGRFRTKSLRHVAETGPFFHDGSADTLTDVVKFYNQGGGAAGTFPGVKDERLVPLNLTENEIADIVEFLRSLTGQPIPEHLRVNTAATAPVSPRHPENAHDVPSAP